MKNKYPVRAVNETGDKTIDVQVLVVPDSAITAGSGAVNLATATGDVTGPSSSTDNAIARFDSTTGKVIQNSTITVSDTGTVAAASGTLTLTSPSVGTTLTMADAANIVVNATTGTKIGTATSQKLALWNATPIIQPASANQAALSLDVDVTGADTVDKAAIDTNFTAIQTLVNQLRTDLIAAGVIKGSA